MRNSKGFTLMEIMVAVAISAILAAVAIPNYTEYVRRGRLVGGTNALSDMRVRAEQFFQDNRTYLGFPGCSSTPPTVDKFTLTCPTLTATTYVFRATGTDQASGFAYTIDQSNNRTTAAVPSGWTSSATCWVIKKDGSC